MIALAVVFGLALSPQQAKAQSKCSIIKNGIERLACFDAEFPAQPSSNAEPAQIFDRLRGLIRSTPDLYGNHDQVVAFDGNYLDIVTYSDGCDMGILHIVPVMGRRGSDAFGVTRLLGYEYTYLELDVKKIADVQLAGTPGDLSVSMTKGNEIARYTFWASANPNFNTDVNSQMMVFNSQGGLVPDMKRTQSIRIVTEPEDIGEAQLLLSSLVKACQTN